ncbi:hypothetical protein PN836_000900 [Ningiella sp. W23]|uniref:hypothetical protein n=1 Tax=Ningiella sp. W23 TaxID=3023715 RepID=UPI0037574387
MKKQSFIAAALLLLSVQANALIISLEGEQADGESFNIFTVNNTDTREVLDLSFNFIYEAFTPSWGADLVLEIAHIDSGSFFQVGTQDFGCTDLGVLCEFDLCLPDESGVFSAAGMISLPFRAIIDGSGVWEILIADSFDDSGIDGQFLSGSFVEVIQGERVIAASGPSSILILVCIMLMLSARKRRI